MVGQEEIFVIHDKGSVSLMYKKPQTDNNKNQPNRKMTKAMNR